MSRSAGESVFLFSWEKLGMDLLGTIVSSKAVPEVLDMKYRSEFKYGVTNHGCLHCATLKALYGKKKEPAKQEICIFSFRMFKMRFSRFSNFWKKTGAACWINSKISKETKNTTLMIFLCCHYYWSLLWCYYCKSLKSDPHYPRNLFYLLWWKPFI